MENLMRGIIARRICLAAILLCWLTACETKREMSSVGPVNWEKRAAGSLLTEALTKGSTYLPVYSQIYQLHEKVTYDLTVTVSLRNISPKDTVFIFRADYYNTEGHIIRKYFNDPIYIKPLETVEIVIDEADTAGGTGGNFIFDWGVPNERNAPLFEAVMISTTGQQGLSFLTRGVRIFD